MKEDSIAADNRHMNTDTDTEKRREEKRREDKRREDKRREEKGKHFP